MLRFPLAAAPLALLCSQLDASPQWRESHGGPSGSYWTDAVEGPQTAPVERWRVDLDEILCDPVVHGGHVAVVAKRRRIAQLVILDLETGEEVVRKRVRADERAAISFDGTFVSVATDMELYCGEFRTGQFKRSISERGSFLGIVSSSNGVVAAPIADRTEFHDIREGERLGIAALSTGKPIPVPGRRAFRILTVSDTPPSGESNWRAVQLASLTEFQGRSRLLINVAGEVGRPAEGSPAPPEPFMATGLDGRGAIVVTATTERFGGSWIHLVPSGVIGNLTFSSYTFAAPGIVVAGRLIGRTGDRSVVSVVADSKSLLLGSGPLGGARERVLVDGEHLPQGVVDAPMSAAGSVLLLGNWAIDAATSRVLWVAPGLDVAGRPIPASDGGIVFVASDGALVHAVAEAPAVAVGVAAEARGGSRPSAAGLPGDGSAVVLRDGTRIPGEVSREGGRVVVTSPDGETSGPWRPFAVGAIESADELGQVRVPHALFRASNASLRDQLRAELLEVAEESAELALVANATGLLLELRRLGLDAEALISVTNVLATKRELGTATRGVKLEKVQRMESEAREDARERRAAQVRWLAREGLAVQAAALLWESYVDDGHPGPVVDLPGRVVDLAVEIAPDVEAEDAFQWLLLQSAFAPADVRYATKEDARGVDAQTEVWRRCTMLRTPNILLLARERRPRVVAGVLLFGETTIQALDDVLGPDPSVADQPFDVRLHASREEYAAEEVGGEPIAPGWSAGFYNELVRTSRFFVPDVDPARLERDLYKTVAHELTHQYIAERWKRRVDTERRSPKSPGFWIIEGFARFIEDQSVEMSRRGLDFDDATVSSIEVTAALLEAGETVPMDEFLALRQLDLQRLSMEEETTVVHLTNERVSYDVDALGGFYAQAGALAFFLMNRAGEEGPGRLVEALEAHYSGETEREGWVALGYESAEALQADFEAFLRASVAR